MSNKRTYIVVDAVEEELAAIEPYIETIKTLMVEIASAILPFHIPLNLRQNPDHINVSNIVHSALDLLDKQKTQIKTADWDRYNDWYQSHVLSFPVTKGAAPGKRHISLTEPMVALVKSIGDYIKAYDIGIQNSHSGNNPSLVIICTIAVFHLHDYLLKVQDKPGLLIGSQQWTVNLDENLEMQVSVCIKEKQEGKQ